MNPILVMLGSNINKEVNLPKAIEKIRALPEVCIEAVSGIYETAPIGHDGKKSEQPAFYNAAVYLQTELSAIDLRNTLRQIEHDLGRMRGDDKFAARTIDIDIAFYGQSSVELLGETVPSSDIARLAHLAVPLADVAPTWVHPATGQTLRTLADHLIKASDNQLSKISTI